ncbi:MAG: hypothetical protein JJV98_15125 [Desulfosarcina sp.]|nr:hypothetical protein [Desulfobacterales bacterium]
MHGSITFASWHYNHQSGMGWRSAGEFAKQLIKMAMDTSKNGLKPTVFFSNIAINLTGSTIPPVMGDTQTAGNGRLIHVEEIDEGIGERQPG